METVLRPHRGGTVLTLGILSLPAAMLFLPLGIVAWILGSIDMKAMNRGEVDPSGRSLTQAGWVCGIVAAVLWFGSAAMASIFFMSSAGITASTMSLEHDGVRTRSVSYSRNSTDASTVESQSREVRRPDGTWIKEGPAVRWSRDGKKLEEGRYRDGKRDGMWTFWNEDGSVDHVRTGDYDADIRIPTDVPINHDAPIDDDGR